MEFNGNRGMSVLSKKIGLLTLGEDIEEVFETQGLELSVSCLYGNPPQKDILHSLRIYARDKHKDFVSIEKFSEGQMGLFIGEKNGLLYYCVRPRLFQTIR